PAEDADVERLGVSALEEEAEVGAGDAGPDPDLRERVLQDLGHREASSVVHREDFSLEAVRVARLGEQRLRALDVRRGPQALHALRVRPVRWRNGAVRADLLGEPRVDGLDRQLDW